MTLFTNAADAKRFVTAGNAIFTLQSRKTGSRYTYRARAGKSDGDHPAPTFLQLLTGPDNTSDYTYLGVINNTGTFHLTRNSKLTMEAPSVRAAKFFCDIVLVGGKLPEALEVRHEGRCCRCNRLLTVPESVDRGIGPECWAKM